MRVSVKPLVANNFEAAIQAPCIPLHTKTITEKHMKKAITTAQKIKNMIQAGFPNAEIMKAVPKATAQQISNHRYLMKKNGVTAAENVRANKFVAAVLTKRKRLSKPS
jgi:DNA-binding protein H-NS